ncbi:hypothetical protein Leryth_003455 [Lithospermum erythrorhizon]|nr:hypothetical protein Leryth_003455 [Lithospermum erythrorhizon]
MSPFSNFPYLYILHHSPRISIISNNKLKKARMASSTFQVILRTFHSRKLLFSPSFNQSSASTLTSVAPPPGSHDLLKPTAWESSFDSNAAMEMEAIQVQLLES